MSFPRYLDDIAVAVKYTLRADTDLVAWCRREERINRLLRSRKAGTGHRGIDVWALSSTPSKRTADLVEVAVEIGVFIMDSTHDRPLDDTEESLASVASGVNRALKNNYYLERPETGGVRLVERLDAFANVDVRELQDREGTSHYAYLAIAGYVTQVNGTTWEIDL